MVKNHFKEDFGTVFKHLSSSNGGGVTDDDMRSLLFGDYMKPDAVRSCTYTCTYMYMYTHTHTSIPKPLI